MRELYAGCDLHGNSNLVGIIDGEGKRVFKKNLSNDLPLIRDALKPFQRELIGIVVESTYNWYWMVDGLMEEGYRVHLANPSAIQRYVGLKHADDKHDAFWLAEMLRLGILPEGYIYPKGERPLRDLLRKRGHLVRLRTSLVISLQNILSRNRGVSMIVNDVKWLKRHEDRIQVFYLPSYSPDLNPDENLNQDVKSNAVGRRRPHDQKQMIRHVRSYLYGRQRRPQLVKKYFEAKSVRYAAV
jgi:transposase